MGVLGWGDGVEGLREWFRWGADSIGRVADCGVEDSAVSRHFVMESLVFYAFYKRGGYLKGDDHYIWRQPMFGDNAASHTCLMSQIPKSHCRP